ncbi:hypothetical protein MVES1_002315 [Malassezia vespertilionis]|uniref:uncharacterized protein n=1 Tax=Malassezia vespertilionis TaxID=2020962 RepID=UPI0024B0EBC6|nr:uncharacterized protein MVES1_002315 [Malassezia vespertilionis]WFD06960.1 hypothetical protein MVES1_002315 [Malassezia vespertilionis]
MRTACCIAQRIARAHLHVRAQSTLSKAERFVVPIDAKSLPRGYLVASTYAGVKNAISPSPAAALSGVPKPDLALVVSSTPAAIAGVFTTNKFQAAPVVHATNALQAAQPNGPRAIAVLANSGCANAVTGKEGLEDTEELVELVRNELNPASKPSQPGPSDVLMLSTGVIGVRLPVGTIRRALYHLVHGQVLQSNPEAWLDVARAYMTTDTFPKLRTRQFMLGDRQCSMLAIDKGAGMIHPHMTTPGGLHATLLGLVATDAPIAPAALQKCLEEAVRVSFNCISVDGDMSTNDTILALANGQAPTVQGSADKLPHGAEISESSHPALLAKFSEQLTSLCLEMAHLVVRDGEGAEKFVQVRVRGAGSYEDAHAIASSISTSSLVKCAMHGADANWGRILCAAGYATLTGKSGWTIDPHKVNVTFVAPEGVQGIAPLPALVNGTPLVVDEAHAAELLRHEDICVDVDMQGGSWSAKEADAEAVFWTCDFSKEYVAINGDYRT